RSLAIDHGHLPRAGNVDKNARTFLFELKRFRVRGERDISNHFRALRVENAERAAAVSDINTLRGDVIAYVIRIVFEVDRTRWLESPALVDIHPAASVTCHDDAFCFRDVGDRLRRSQAPDRMNPFA